MLDILWLAGLLVLGMVIASYLVRPVTMKLETYLLPRAAQLGRRWADKINGKR